MAKQIQHGMVALGMDGIMINLSYVVFYYYYY